MSTCYGTPIAARYQGKYVYYCEKCGAEWPLLPQEVDLLTAMEFKVPMLVDDEFEETGKRLEWQVVGSA